MSSESQSNHAPLGPSAYAPPPARPPFSHSTRSPSARSASIRGNRSASGPWKLKSNVRTSSGGTWDGTATSVIGAPPRASRRRLRGSTLWHDRSMRFTVQYPLAMPGYAPEFLTASGIARFARAAEDAGFDALAFTEHPAPSHRWVASGGHDTFDPLTALACAAVSTERIRLLPYTLILPYRNPWLMAKSLATLSLVSEGRLVVGTGTGYLRSEALALGVDFDERNELF